MDLDGWDVPVGGSLTWNLSAKTQVGSDKKSKPVIRNFTITYVDGGQDPPGSRLFTQSCDAMWAPSLAVFMDKGFDPESSDKAGGVLKLRWSKGNSGWLAANGDVKTLTKARTGLFANYEGFRVDSASAIFVPSGSGCRLKISLAYAGFLNGLSKGWFVLESNGRMELGLLKEIQDRVAGGNL